MSDNTVTASIGLDKDATELKTSVHTLYADEPTDQGGEDTGPAPGDLLRMSLASCTAITLRMYANRKHWDVQKIEVKVKSEQVEGKTIFTRAIEINGNIDKKQRERMLEIANSCPIHKALTNPIEVNTVLFE